MFGCTSWSDPLNVEFYEGTGTVIGQVWLDVNENGIIDDEDENLSGINIQITDENISEKQFTYIDNKLV